MELRPFDPVDAEKILSWLTHFQDTYWWCARKTHPLSPDIFLEWHRDPDIQPYLFYDGETAIAYGEIWLDTLQAEAELGRLLVVPEQRGKGIGASCIVALLDKVPNDYRVYARIFPQNIVSQRCFAKIGFERLSPEKTAEFNEWEAQPFVWLEWLNEA